VAVVALLAAVVGLGWNWWRYQPAPVAEALTPTRALAATTTLTPSPVVTPTATASPTTPTPSPTPIIHVVQSGETVMGIASHYGIDPDTVMAANGLDQESARLLHSGQELVIPSTGPVGGPLPGGNAQGPQIVHVVQTGDTLSSIAVQYDASLDAIMAVNDLSSVDLIYAGQSIIVPLNPPTATPPPTSTPTPTSTPGPPYVSPDLLFPANGQVFERQDAAIVLTWTSVGILSDNEMYLVTLQVPGRIDPVTHATQATSWRLPSDLWPTGRQHDLTWQVTVVKQENPGSDEPAVWHPLSDPSDTRALVWR
jgi:LysM repeat protein